MATKLDTKLVPKILSLVNKYGKTLVFYTYPLTAYDPTTGEETEGAATTYSLKTTPPAQYESKLIDGDLVRNGDTWVLLPASGLEFTPVPGIKVTFDSITLKIVSVEKIYTGDLIGAYTLQLRE